MTAVWAFDLILNQLHNIVSTYTYSRYYQLNRAGKYATYGITFVLKPERCFKTSDDFDGWRLSQSSA